MLHNAETASVDRMCKHVNNKQQGVQLFYSDWLMAFEWLLTLHSLHHLTTSDRLNTNKNSALTMCPTEWEKNERDYKGVCSRDRGCVR